MIKKIYTAAVAVLLALSMTACGNGGDSAENETSAVATTSEETTTKAKTTTATLETTTAEETTTTAEETSAASETAETNGDNLFHGDGYTLSVDPEVWIDCTDYFKSAGLASDVAEEDDVDYSEDEVQNMFNAVFVHTSLNGTNINIVRVEVGDVGDDFDIGILEPYIRKECEQIPGITYLSGETVSVNGYDAVKVIYEDETGEFYNKKDQYTFVEGTFKYVITYTVTKDDYEVFLPDFEAVVQSIRFE
ncbi:MAG: hypothetical protein ACI4SF_10045 [Oscillospiraceae bacterium]